MSVKLLMQWDINPGTESEYSEFIINEFIPRIKRLGLTEIQFWYTTFGDCEQIQASGIAEDNAQMQLILESDAWQEISQRLADYVEEFSAKVIRSKNSFQL